MDENTFLKSIFPMLEQGKDIVVGPGDDCAVIDIGNKNVYYLMAADQIISDVHFDPKITTGAEAGAKLIKRNISDIAAMGGKPAHAVLTVAAEEYDYKWLHDFYIGLSLEANRYSVSICGGDLASIKTNKTANSSGREFPTIVTTLTITGYVEKSKLCLRKNAIAGDAIFITGLLGNSYSSKHHLKFTPRVNEADFLSKNYTNCMIDISDGFLMDLIRICSASTVSAKIDEDVLPKRSKSSLLKNLLADGEDYELIFTVPQAKAEKLLNCWPFQTQLTQIGKIIDIADCCGKVSVFNKNGNDLSEAYQEIGWDHLI